MIRKRESELRTQNRRRREMLIIYCNNIVLVFIRGLQLIINIIITDKRTNRKRDIEEDHIIIVLFSHFPRQLLTKRLYFR